MTDPNPELVTKATDVLGPLSHEYRVDPETWRTHCICGWTADEPHDVAAFDRHLAVSVLEAVADDLRAEALEGMADELHRLDDGRTGGYYDAGRHIIARLRERAAKLREAS